MGKQELSWLMGMIDLGQVNNSVEDLDTACKSKTILIFCAKMICVSLVVFLLLWTECDQLQSVYMHKKLDSDFYTIYLIEY